MQTTLKNKAAVLHGGRDLRILDRDVAEPKEGEATIKIHATGLCGSDLHYFVHGRNGDFVVQDPMCLGHEAAGEVVALGKGVTGFAVGDRVAIEAGVNCGECRYCKMGKYNHCPKMSFCSSAKTYPHRDGTLQTYMNHPVRMLYKLSDSISYEEASLVEPLSVVIHGVRRAAPKAGETALVLGAGAVGLLSCAMAKVSGASNITVVDIDPKRIEFAINEGFASNGHTLARLPRPENMQEGIAASKKSAAEIVSSYANGEDGYDLVYECTGVQSCIQMAAFAARACGKVLFIGMGTPVVEFPLGAAALREVDLIGVFRYSNTYEEALAMISAGRLPDIGKLVTNRYPVERANEAFETLARGKNEDGSLVIKIMVGQY